jgi:hypothetical protein
MIQAACLSQACVCWHRRLSVSGTVDVLCSQRNAQESPDPSADKSLQDLHLKLYQRAGTAHTVHRCVLTLLAW